MPLGESSPPGTSPPGMPPRGPRRAARGLAATDFVRVAEHGFGDGQNSYAFSMSWSDDALTVGTVRNMLALIETAPPPNPTRLKPWPVRMHDDIYAALDLRAQLWRYRPAADRWSLIFSSPMLEHPHAGPAPRDIGYRHMTRFQSSRDDAPALYVATAASGSRGRGAHVLRLAGDDDVQVSAPVLGDRTVSTLRTLVGFRERVFMSPTGSGRAWNAADSPCVYESPDPIGGAWRAVSAPCFGDPSNDAMYCMAVFRDHLYVGTLNHTSGYQLWKTKATGTRPYRWTRVLDGGAGRGNLNEGIVSMCVFNDALYLGGGISNGGYDRTYGIGPAGAELVRVYPDDSWDLVAGTPRETPQGFKNPRSGMGPGFDHPAAGYFWSMAVHDGWLYVGTFDSTVFTQWRNPRFPPRAAAVIDPELLVRRLAGFDLWRTRDGLNWTPVTRNGFGNAYNYGARTLVSTPVGLFVGTANPFGPEVAVKMPNGWEYVPNPRGGAEVWLGR
jgi:hypothetical protein